MPSHREVRPAQRTRARRLRTEMTDAERKLWLALRGHRFHGLSFRRQSPMGPYIVDFACHERRLVLAIDGGQHGTSPGLARDDRRDAWLAARGYRVLRFWNNEVLDNFEGVLTAIVAAIELDVGTAATGVLEMIE
jgi:very-short-patch-repair endonuclease